MVSLVGAPPARWLAFADWGISPGGICLSIETAWLGARGDQPFDCFPPDSGGR